MLPIVSALMCVKASKTLRVSPLASADSVAPFRFKVVAATEPAVIEPAVIVPMSALIAARLVTFIFPAVTALAAILTAVIALDAISSAVIVPASISVAVIVPAAISLAVIVFAVILAAVTASAAS